MNSDILNGKNDSSNFNSNDNNFIFDSLPKSNFISPIYHIEKVKVWDIVAQSFNPNSLNSKNFSALQRSIFNNGYAMCVTTCRNASYDEEADKKLSRFEKIKMHIEGSENDARSGSHTSGLEYATQISDPNIRKAFKVEIIDGAQRTGVIRMGTYLFMMKSKESQLKMINSWINGENIPDEPGRNMLMYLAWREDFSVPCSILEGKSDPEKMSATVLFNTAVGAHRLDSTKEIVYNLINVANMSPEWVSKNLFIDLESIKRMVQLSGLKQAYNNIEESDLSWNPYKDDMFEKKASIYLNREAAKYVQSYISSNPELKDKLNTSKDIIEYAKSLGWKYENEEISLDSNNE